jgi:hypothetical protein
MYPTYRIYHGLDHVPYVVAAVTDYAYEIPRELQRCPTILFGGIRHGQALYHHLYERVLYGLLHASHDYAPLYAFFVLVGHDMPLPVCSFFFLLPSP